jgi:hypothetical protein
VIMASVALGLAPLLSYCDVCFCREVIHGFGAYRSQPSLYVVSLNQYETP